jgi:hypothetical protein
MNLRVQLIAILTDCMQDGIIAVNYTMDLPQNHIWPI